jgi:peptide/nickel transport system permease protein
MATFFAKRIGVLLFTMLAVSFLLFLTFEFSPGDVARNVLGPFATDVQLQLYREEHGLNRPFIFRYIEWLGNFLRGDLGYSTLYKTQVNNFIWDRIGHSLLLAGLTFAIIAPGCVILGIAAGMREGSLLDRVISLFSMITTSIPEYASGVFLVCIFVIWLGVLPGTSPMEEAGGWSLSSQLVLPVMVLVGYYLGYLVRMVRASMVEVMTRPYIRTAVLKGLTYRDVILKHAVRNAMITPFTAILLQLNFLVSSVVIVEAVFAYPGFGRMMLDAGLYKDVSTVEAGALFGVFFVVLTQMIGDFSYMVLNPRIRFS